METKAQQINSVDQTRVGKNKREMVFVDWITGKLKVPLKTVLMMSAGRMNNKQFDHLYMQGLQATNEVSSCCSADVTDDSRCEECKEGCSAVPLECENCEGNGWTAQPNGEDDFDKEKCDCQ